MKTPKLEEVKEHFKDAEIVLCYYNGVYKIIIETVYLDEDNEYWCKCEDTNEECCLFVDIGYSKIVTTRTKSVTIEVSKIDELSDNKKLGEYVRQLKNELSQ